jgi:serine/threonine-protein kinase
MSAIAIAIAFHSNELSGPACPYIHGITFVIVVRSAIVPAPIRETLAHGVLCVAMYPLVFAGIYAVTPHPEWFARGGSAVLAVNYILVCSSVGVGVVASHTSWLARQELHQARKLGRYRLEARLGKGMQGEVWLARDAALDRDVALKILRGASASPQALAAFEREAQLASKLKSPHTVRIHDHGASDDGIHFIAMEHLVGHDFAEMVHLFGPTTPAHAAHLVAQACHSLEEAHAAGLVHRDVKPSNLFAAEAGEQRDVVKLLDFGVARTTREDDDLRKTSVRGTPTYLAPEVCKGEHATASSDLYALGATLYFLVSGSPPFVGDVIDVINGHRNETPERPSVRLGRELPAAFEAVIMRCLAKEPAERYASARDLRQALETCDGVRAWTREDARAFWEHERSAMVRRWTDETVA